MKNVLLAIFAIMVASAAVAQSDSLSLEQQFEIIESYLYLRGEIDRAPSHLLSEDGEVVPVRCGTSIASEYARNKDKLSPHLLKQLGVMLEDRPSLPSFRDSDAGWFKIHYTTTGSDSVYRASVDTDQNGHPDYVDGIARIMDSVHMYIHDTLGYPLPPADSFYTSGGDEKVDVYIENIGASFYGLTYQDSVLIDGGITATAFMILDNDYQPFSDYRDRPLDAVRVTAAHEYFHVVQFGMDVTEKDVVSGTLEKRAWMEMSAVWMEEQLYDDINDYYGYLTWFYLYPWRSMQEDHPSRALRPYASVVFPLFLSQKYDRDIIREIWQQCADRGSGNDMFVSVDSAIRLFDTGSIDDSLLLADAFREFSLWNYFTGERTAMNPIDTLGYEEAENYPAIPNGFILADSTQPIVSITNAQGLLNNGPEHWGTSYTTFAHTYALIWDTAYFVCYDISCDSVLPLAQDPPPGLDTIAVIDSTFSFGVAPTPKYPRWWGANMVYFVRNEIDSVEIESSLLPPNLDSSTVYNLEVVNPQRYDSVTFMISAASTLKNQFVHIEANPGDNRRPVFFVLTDELDTNLIITDTLDVAVAGVEPNLIPYPNPVVISEMNGDLPRVVFRYDIGSSAAGYAMAGDAFLSVDIFTLGGERVNSLSSNVSGTLAETSVAFEMDLAIQNLSGNDLASGVYLVVGRLYTDDTMNTLLAEETAKMVLVR